MARTSSTKSRSEPRQVRTIVRSTLTDQVADAIVELMRGSGLGEGDPIPATSDLATQFGVSRPVVREALAQLAGRGLLHRQQGREGVFSLPGSEHLASLLSHRVSHQHIEFGELQEFREIIEVAAAKLAARHATDAQIGELQSRLAAMRGAGTEARFYESDVAFHRAVAEASANQVFVLVLDGLAPLLRDGRRQAWQGWVQEGGSLGPVLDAHAAIAEAIGRHRESEAGAAMEAHLRQARRGFEALRGERSKSSPGRNGSRKAPGR